MSNYLFWVEYEDGDFSLAEMERKPAVERLMEWYEKHNWSIVKAYGWTVDDDSLSTKIIKNKAKKAKKND